MKKIVIVEDENDIVELLKIVFRNSDYDVLFFCKSLDNDEIQLLYPDLILLDIRLIGSVKSGIDICRELKSTPSTSTIPVVLISAEYNLAEIAAECGADYFINKPYDLFSLLLKIKQYLT
jgi:two-component system response regulator VicR